MTSRSRNIGKIGRLFLADVFRFRPAYQLGILALLVLAGIAEGAGLLMMVPLLAIVGVLPAADGVSANAAAFLQRLPSGFTSSLESVLALFLLVVLLRAGLSYLVSVSSARLRGELVEHVRQRIYRALSRASWTHLIAYSRSQGTYALTTQTENVGYAHYRIFHLAASSLTICAGIAVAALLSPVLTLVVIAAAGLLVIPLARFHGLAFSQAGQTVRALQGLHQQLAARADTLKVAKALSLESSFETSFAVTSNSYRSAAVEAQRIQARATLAQEVGAAIVLVVLVYVSIVWAAVGALQLVMLIVIFARILPRINSLQNDLRSFIAGLPEYQSLRELEAGAHAAEEQAPEHLVPMPMKQGLALRDVTFQYPNPQQKHVALRDVTLELPAFRAIGIAGHSGAGKTTLVDILAGLLVPTQGVMEVDGIAIDARLRPHWRSGIAYVPQDAPMLHDTIRANLVLGSGSADDEEIWRCLRLVKAEGLVRRQPKGLDSVMGDRGVMLSGGERQRIRLAAALLRNPSIIFLDEATSALSPNDERDMIQTLRDLLSVTTIVLVAHRLSSLAWTDFLIVMKDGRLANFGPTVELLDQMDNPSAQVSKNVDPLRLVHG